MKSIAGFGLGVVLSAVAAAGVAHAADPGQWAATATAVLTGLGQGIGDAGAGGPSILVTATGHAKLGVETAGSFSISFEGKSDTAEGATNSRDRAVTQAMAAAKQYEVESSIVAEAFSRARASAFPYGGIGGIPQVPPPLFIKPAGVAAADESTTASGTGKKFFVDRVTIRFHPADPKRVAAFLDALVAAGIDYDLQDQFSPEIFNPFAGIAGGGEQKVDDTTWDRATVDAVNAARRQADVMANAAGRRVGDARQILLISKSVQAGEASVIVAIRYGLVPPS